MTDDELAAIEARLRAATPGPWSAEWDTDLNADDVRVCFLRDGQHCEWCIALAGETLDGTQWTPETLKRWRSDADLIAHAPSDIAALVAEVRRRGTKLAAIGQLLSDNGCDCDCDHAFEEHDGCELCLGCRIDAVLATPAPGKPEGA